MKHAAALSLALVILSNGLTLFTYAAGVDRQLLYVPWAVVLLVAACFWARRAAHLSWTEIGLCGVQWKRTATIGTLTGFLLAAPPLLFLIFPFLLTEPARYREIQNLDAVGLLWRLGVELTIATALTEELVFRGILQALFKRSLSAIRALVATNFVFALWHLAINALTLEQNTLALPLIPTAVAQTVGYLGSLIVVGIGGVILSVLRERTNHLAGSIAAHWVSVAAMTIVLYLRAGY